jgi:ketosteroid isomerase-like protein
VSDDAATDLAKRLIDALNARDWATVGQLFAPDIVTDWPQSNERVRGLENFRHTMEAYPGRAEAADVLPVVRESAQVFAAEDRWVMTPTFTTIRVSGGIDKFSIVGRATYPGNEIWYMVNLLETHEGRVTRTVTFFAPTYPAPEWRAQWVEPLETRSDDGHGQG